MQISVIRLSHFLLLKLNPFIKVPPGVKMPGKKGGLIKDIELCRFYWPLFCVYMHTSVCMYLCMYVLKGTVLLCMSGKLISLMF